MEDFTVTQSQLFVSITEKLDTRSKRIGLSRSTLHLDPVSTEDGSCRSTLTLTETVRRGDPGIETGEKIDSVILQVSAGNTDTVSFAEISTDPVYAEKVRLPGCATAAGPGDDGKTHITFDLSSEESLRQFCLFIADIASAAFDLYEPVSDPFETCSRCYTCGIKGECLHPDQMYARVCRTRASIQR